MTGGGVITAAESYDYLADAWTARAALATARYLATATELDDGGIVVVGGRDAALTALDTAAAWDWDTLAWTTAAGSMPDARYNHAAALVSATRLLIAGGEDGGGGFLATACECDLETGLFAATTGPMAVARCELTLTRLPSGKILVAGGRNGGGFLATCQIYDPDARTFSAAASMAHTRAGHTATVLPDGHVLVTGGNGTGTGWSEIYDESTDTWQAPILLHESRYYHAAVVLRDGRVLVAGGRFAGVARTSAEIFDLNTEAWTLTGALATGRYYSGACRLANGRVLLTGGMTFVGMFLLPLATCEMYDHVEGSWGATAPMGDARYAHAQIIGAQMRQVVSPWEAEFGTDQGRIAPPGWTPPAGTYALCLGSADRGQVYRLRAGTDEIAWWQMDLFAGAMLVRAPMRITLPTAIPLGAAFTVAIRVDARDRWSKSYVSTSPELGKTIDLSDAVINVSKDAGVAHVLVLRLELGATGAPVDVEVCEPTVYIDDIEMDLAPGQPAIINREPPPNATDIAVDVTTRFQLVDIGAAGPQLDQLYCDGVLIYDGGVVTPGWTVNVNPTADPDIIAVDFLPPADFDSEATVTVRVLASTVGGASSIDETYHFHCADVDPPQLTTAQGRELRRVRVTFNEAVKQVAAANSDDALNPANYTLARQTTPAVQVVVESVETVAATQVDLLADIDLTPGATYQLTVANVEDPVGNAIAAPDHVVTFAAFTPPQPNGRRWSLWQMIPALNREEDATGDLANFVSCFQEVADLLIYDVDRWTDILDPDYAPENFLDAILASLGNPFALAEVDKRRLANVLVDIYREKGTDEGIIDSVRFFLGLEVTIVCPFRDEWWILGIRGTLGGEDPTGRVVTVDAVTDVFTLAAHGFSDGDEVSFTTTGALPGGLALLTIYYVRDATAATFKVSATEGGSAVDITDAGAGVHSVHCEVPGVGIVGSHLERERFVYEIHSAVALTAIQRTQITTLAEYMQPANMHLTSIVEPP